MPRVTRRPYTACPYRWSLTVEDISGGNTSIAARGETAVLLAARQSGPGRLTLGNNVTFTTISGSVTVVPD